MFIDYIMEGAEFIDEPVSESTMEYINNLEATDFSESTLSPFELMEKSIYEYCKENADVINHVSKIELNYLREHGEEPVWEASDSENIVTKAVALVGRLIKAITGAFQKLMKMIDDKINAYYKKVGADFEKKLTSAQIKDVDISQKKFTFVKYDPDPGIRLLAGAKDVASVMKSIPEYATLYNYVFSGKESDYKKGDFNASVTSEKLIKQLMGNTPGEITDISSAKSALKKVISPEKGEYSFNEALYEIRRFRADPRASKMKAALKKYYTNIINRLGKLIDFAKSYNKQCKKNKNAVASNIAGAVYNILTTYSSTVTMIYKEVVSCTVSRWNQSLKLTSQVVKSLNTQAKADNKEMKAASKAVNAEDKKKK